ncbi:hypothetical protein KTF36_17525 [Burkholderia gladioli]|uniref:hypothetical protein n=1 Tax=Burkholderia gladioli TaxID=28095 RepID=UPI001C22B378|nr:hypothetical protein [Burkholderia gladioli]MBU9643653.1 hypothetical protein [Burkholderia gladioli]
MQNSNEPMLDMVLRNLDAAKGAWPAIARQCGMPYQTLTKIALRIHRDPRVSTVQLLHDYFAKTPAFPPVREYDVRSVVAGR